MTFHVGQKVVCVNVSPPLGGGGRPSPLVKNRIYTVSGFGRGCESPKEDELLLAEQPGRNWMGEFRADIGFRASRFRPITERKNDGEAFVENLRTLCNPSSPKVKEREGVE